ncbi:unnamed protein product [Choristocarpus tenellus]
MGCSQSGLVTADTDLPGKGDVDWTGCRSSTATNSWSVTSNLDTSYQKTIYEEGNTTIEAKSRPQPANDIMPVGTVKKHLSMDWTQAESLNEDKENSLPCELTLEEVKVKHHIADGGFCAVHACLYKGKDVVVKVPKSCCSDPRGAIAGVKNEIEIFKKLDHKYLCKFYGFGQGNDNKPFIILEELKQNLAELCGMGTAQQEVPLKMMLKRRRLKRELPFRRRLELGLELAQLIKYLHEDAISGGCVLHRDLKPRNVGLSHDGHIQVFDLGLARVVESRKALTFKYEMTGETGSQRYMAPEVWKGEPYNEKVDVYSFGLILWEMLSLNQVFSSMSSEEHILQVLEGGLRPPFEKCWTEEVKEILNGCWQQESDQRITASAAVEKLTNLLQSYDTTATTCSQ